MEGSAESAIDANLSNGSGASSSNGTMEAALQRMVTADPELAARLIVHSLPAAAAKMPSNLSWRLSVEGLGDWTVRGSGDGGPATVEPSNGDAGEDFAIETDSLGLARLAAGSSPLGLMLRRRLRQRGKRRKALKLRHLDPEAGPREMAKFGVEVDPD
ncbi:MAG: hypothetical protein M3R23_06830, partial [Actinomycetota bacterium]|nr:hypothetical protein [Actinomycetota bacterium]